MVIGLKIKEKIMYGKTMSWSSGHQDKYVFNGKVWLKVACNLKGVDCMASQILPRGTKFDYNCKLSVPEEINADDILEYHMEE